MIPPGGSGGDPGGRPPRDPTADECVELGLRHFGRDQLAEARLWWTRALALEPGHARAEECLRVLARTVAEQAELARPSPEPLGARGAAPPWAAGTPPWATGASPAPPWSTPMPVRGAAPGAPLPAAPYMGAPLGATPAPTLAPGWAGRTPVGPPWAPAGTPLPWVTTAQPGPAHPGPAHPGPAHPGPAPSGPSAPASPWAVPGTPAPWATRPGTIVPNVAAPSAAPAGPSASSPPAGARPWPQTGWSHPPPAPSSGPWASTTPGGSALDVWSRPGRGGAPTLEPRAPTTRPGAQDPSARTNEVDALPPARPFALGPDSASGAELSPDDLIDAGSSPGLELVVEEPEDLHPDAFGLDAFAQDGASGELGGAVAQTPWDLGPSETSIVTLDDATDTAVAELTPLPSVEPLVLPPGPAGAPPGALYGASGASHGGLSPKSDPIVAPSPRSVLAKAEDRMALHDFSGALELLERVPADAPEAEDARALSLRARHRLEQQYLGKLGALDRVPAQLMADDQLIWLNLDQRAAYLLSRVDGAATFDDLVTLSGMPKLEALRILSELVRDGVIG